MGKSTINGPLSIAMLNYQRVPCLGDLGLYVVNLAGNPLHFFLPGDRRVWTQEEATSFHTDSTRFKRTCRDNKKKTLVNVKHSH